MSLSCHKTVAIFLVLLFHSGKKQVGCSLAAGKPDGCFFVYYKMSILPF